MKEHFFTVSSKKPTKEDPCIVDLIIKNEIDGAKIQTILISQIQEIKKINKYLFEVNALSGVYSVIIEKETPTLVFLNAPIKGKQSYCFKITKFFENPVLESIRTTKIIEANKFGDVWKVKTENHDYVGIELS